MKVRDTTIGPDGTHPLGEPQFKGDKGGINVAFAIMPGTRHAVFHFGTVLSVLAGPPGEMKAFAEHVRRAITEKFGAVPYDVSTLPIKVEASDDHRLVMTHLPTSAETLVANIEVFLALSQRMIEEANKCEASTPTPGR